MIPRFISTNPYDYLNFEIRENVIIEEIKDRLDWTIDKIISNGLLSREAIIKKLVQRNWNNYHYVFYALSLLIDEYIQNNSSFLNGINPLKSESPSDDKPSINCSFIDINEIFNDAMEEDTSDWEIFMFMWHNNGLSIEKFLLAYKNSYDDIEYMDIAFNLENAVDRMHEFGISIDEDIVKKVFH